ncbi:MAG: NFACT RNA binding domain-containing protein [Bacteroidota bacterium]|nr:NFACT RNA binding domain-containing protein [Bacteroidota bacterium]
MLNHFITLQSLADEFNGALKNATVLELFSQQKNELQISLLANTNLKTLSVSITPQMNFIFMREQIARAKRNSISLFTELNNQTINSITGHLFDRIININFSNEMKMLFHLFGTTSANIFLINENKEIINTFKHSKDFVGKSYENLLKSKEDDFANLIADFETFKNKMLEDGNKTTFSAVKGAYKFLGSTLTREALHRAKLEEKVHAGELTHDDLKTIYQQLINLFTEVSKPFPTIYSSNNIPRVFSMIKLEHLTGSTAENYSSVNEAVRVFIAKSFKASNIDFDKKEFLIKIRNELDKLVRTEKAIKNEVLEASRADEYDHIAKVIMTNLQHLTKGTKDIDVEDVFHNDKLMRITLDPKLTPAKNAERYFDKSRKARIACEAVKTRLVDVTKNIALLEKLLLHLDNCQTKEQFAEFKEEYDADLKRMHLISEKEKAALPPFRIFKVAGNFEVLVGKSAANNDLLTMKYAKPNDLWFHARGAGGSHVVLKVGNTKIKPEKEAVKQAASIAAYYSKMRNAGNVPVAYCERKYVRKPKKSNEGTVVLEREKVIFVEPELPEEKT